MKKKISIIFASILGGLSYYLYTIKEKRKVKINPEIENRSLVNDYVVYFDDESKGNEDMFI